VKRRAPRASAASSVSSVVAAALVLLGPARAFANAGDELSNAQNEVAAIDREAATVSGAVQKAEAERLTPEARVANGELLFRSKDYARASVVFSEILEEFPDTPSYPDALWLRAETYYQSHEYLAARRDYRQLVDRGSEARFNPYFARALSRLVDVSLRVDDLKGLDEVFARIGQVPPSQVDAGFNYAKGKAYFARKDYASATASLQAVGPNTPYTHQARYFEGLVQMKIAQQSQPRAVDPNAKSSAKQSVPVNYKAAIDVFHTAALLPPDSDDHKHVIDLSWMAIGRLFYEMEQYGQAADAYSKVDRDSPEFDTMLYELAWVYVRLGDVERSERALEVLSIADPNSPLVGEGTLLRADLLLRAGAFDKALTLYQQVKQQYDPMREKVDTFLSSTTDVAVYYDKLSQQQLDLLDQNDQLPPLAIRWAREAEDGPMAFAVIEDVNQCKTLIKQSNLLVTQLTVLTESANRVRAFPELQAGEERALALLNRVARARLALARGLDDQEPSNVSSDVAQARDARRQLMGMIGTLPTNSGEFAVREQQGVAQWNTLSQELTRRTQEVDELNAVVNGLRRVLKEGPLQGVTRDPQALQQFNTRLDEETHFLKSAQDQITELRRQIEFGRAQIGVGDARYQADAAARTSFRDALDREVTLVVDGKAGRDAQVYASQVQPVLSRARADEDHLTEAFNQLEARVAERIGQLRAKIDLERDKLVGYEGQLGTLDGEARDLVGHVAQRNFTLVRDRLRNMILRADVGVTEQAWEVREEEQSRVRQLQTERAREEQLLDEELKEVIDDSGEPSGGRGK
jgi:tetratricopeptide (TPR) repeat protein